MKCPKCGYLGFETTERCRHCGYDFSLSVTVDNDTSQVLPLRHAGETEAPLGDFDLSGLDTDIVSEPAAALDLDQLTDAPQEKRRAVQTATAVATPPPDEVETLYAPEPSLLLEPPRARPPLAVRRSTPEVPRRRTPRVIKRDVQDAGLQLEPATAPADQPTSRETDEVSRAAPAIRRLTAAVLDAAVLGSINVAVLYLTLAIAGLTLADWRIVPAVPMAAFLVLIDAGYLIVFTATNGQTIGKMVTRIRVIADHDDRVDIAGAVLRAFAALVCIALAGLPYLPVLISKDGRALHDRLSGTRVIKVA